jgi:hypothetical protein
MENPQQMYSLSKCPLLKLSDTGRQLVETLSNGKTTTFYQGMPPLPNSICIDSSQGSELRFRCKKKYLDAEGVTCYCSAQI